MHVHTRARFHSQKFILSFNPIADQILNDKYTAINIPELCIILHEIFWIKLKPA